ncbi:MAG: biotin/lipoyl-binding protein [Phycisphaerae bacterium]
MGVRQDLEVSRHVFRGTPAYVVTDPMTFQSHRLEVTEYAIFEAITPSRALSDIFEDLVKREVMTRDSEEAFYRFIVTLHRFNFLNLPVSDDKLLYRRHEMRQRARRTERLTSFLFLRIPLINPDRFLQSTINYVRPLFTRWFFAVWMVLMLVAGTVAFHQGDRLFQPVEGVLLTHNLPLLMVILVGLKVLHEFGHAYACKHFGGYVPEMGAYMIVFVPCAYVDASASWSFTRVRERVIVCLAGMYIESICAAVATLVWAASPPGLLRDVAYNVIFLAGVVTVLFNINPLMRYDGYYVLSDLLQIPNLRQRSIHHVLCTLKRTFLRIRVDAKSVPPRLSAILFCFGVGSGIYRFLVLAGIATLVAMKMGLVGLALGLLLLGRTIYGTLQRFCKYLWFGQETAPIRFRAVALSLLVIVGIPSLIFLVPIRSDVFATGVLACAEETTVRAPVGGFLTHTAVQAGQQVSPGDVIVQLQDDEVLEAVASAKTQVQASDIRHSAWMVEDPARARQELEQGHLHRMMLERRQRDLADLVVRAD